MTGLADLPILPTLCIHGKTSTPLLRSLDRFKGVSDLLCCSRGHRRCCKFWLCYCRDDCLWFLTRQLLYCWTGLVELRKSQLVSGTCCVLWTLHEALLSLLKIRCFTLNKEKEFVLKFGFFIVLCQLKMRLKNLSIPRDRNCMLFF